MPDKYFEFEGGLKLVGSTRKLPPGSLIGCRNYEITPNGGYSRLFGYAKYNGLEDVYLTDAFGENVLDGDGKPIEVLDVAAIPGSGKTRGVWIYDGDVYAVRDNAGATAAVLHKATTSGWEEQTLGNRLDFTSGGITAIVEGNTITGAISGETATVSRIIVDTGTWAGGDAAGRMYLTEQSGAFQAENLNVGASSNLATIAGDSTITTLPDGGTYEFVNHNFYGSSDRFRMYGVNGVGTGFEWDGTVLIPIATGMTTDTPDHVAAYKNHLFFSFPGGSVQHSPIGDPTAVWSPVLGASELGVSQDVTGFKVEVGDNLFIFCRNKTWVLTGSSSSDWILQVYSEETGAIAGTIQRIGQTIFLDDRGLTSISATQDYGNFAASAFSRDVTPLVLALKEIGATASCIAKDKSQYRIFFGTLGLYCTFRGNKLAGITQVEFSHRVECMVSGETSTGAELILFGDDAGNVYQLDIGSTFAGEDIFSMLRFAYHDYGSPTQRKLFRRAHFEGESSDVSTIKVAAEFSSGENLSVQHDYTMPINPGYYDLSDWDEVAWEAGTIKEPVRLDGVGVAMGLLITDDVASPSHTLYGVTISYDYRGIVR